MDRAIYGVHPVLEKLRAASGEIRRIILQSRKLTPVLREVAEIAKQKGIEVVYHEAGKRGKAWPAASQGVLAEVKPFQYADILKLPETAGPLDAIVVLDGVTDPRNLGAVLRVAEAVGARAVVIPAHRSAEVSPVVAKAASGALSYLKVCRVLNLRETLRSLKHRGYWIVGLEQAAPTSIRDIPALNKVVLVAGSEGSGIRRLVKEECDWTASIPMWGHVQSLNVSVAVGVALYLLVSTNHSRG